MDKEYHRYPKIADVIIIKPKVVMILQFLLYLFLCSAVSEKMIIKRPTSSERASINEHTLNIRTVLSSRAR